MFLFPENHNELLSLAESMEKKLHTTELHKTNDFYGNASVLKQFCNYPRKSSIMASIEHGVFYDDFIWDVDVKAPFASILAPSPARMPIITAKTNKTPFAIGPVVHYASPAASKEDMHKIKKQLGSVLLAFPKHSCHWTDAVYDIEEYCRQLKIIGKDFDTILISVYWKDVLRGIAKEFLKRGFPCVTAGHMFNPFFLNRWRSIIEIADMGTSNFFSSALGYCVHFGKPFHLTIQEMTFVTEDEELRKQREEIFEISSGSWEDRLEKAFSMRTEHITAEQKEIIDNMWGSDCVRDKATLRRILDLSAEMHNEGYPFADIPSIPLLKAVQCMNDKRHSDALLLLEGLDIKSLSPEIATQALTVRIQCHLDTNNHLEALKNAKLMLQVNPGNSEALQIIQKISNLVSQQPAG